jgi:2-keto-4-pentenoate hydratase
MTVSVDTAVARMIAARANGEKIAPLSDEGALSIENGYDVQDAFRAQLINRGQRPLGWKLAATGPVGRELLGVSEPIFGFLFPKQYANGAEISAAEFVDLHVEAEIAFRIADELSGPDVDAPAARRAVDCVLPAFELPDLTFTTMPPPADMIANSALGGAILLGDPVTLRDDLDLSKESIVFDQNRQEVSTTHGSDIMGDPLNALAWLANRLAKRGESLQPGDIVMTGGISTLIRPDAGDVLCARFSSLGQVTMNVTD